MSDNCGMKTIALILIAAMISACAKNNDPEYTPEEMSAICSDLNQKYTDKTKAQLYGLKEQARQGINYYMADNEKFEYYTNLYNEYKLASECK